MSEHLNRRYEWTALPHIVRDEVEHRLGFTVADAKTQNGGFTSGVAAVLSLQDGTSVFVKALPAADGMAGEYRSEAVIAIGFPATVRAPRFRFSFEIEEWIVLAFDAVDGAIPQQPWRDGELANVVQAISDLADILTPSPIPNVSPMSEVMGDEFQTFARLLRDGVSGPLCRVDLDGSVQERLADLASLEAGWRVAAAGSTLTHHDLRVDNILIDRDGNVWIVDWSSPCLAAPWVDIATFLPTIRREPKEMERLFLSTSAGLSATPRDVDRFVAALAGMWFERSSRPIVEHAPHLRDHQRRCAQAAFDWLRFRCFDIDTEAVVS